MSTQLQELGLDKSFHPVQATTLRRFTCEQIAGYNRDGYISGIPLFEGEHLREIQRFFEKQSEDLLTYNTFRSFHHTVPELYDIVTEALLVEHLQDLLGPNVVCFVSQYICKQPGDLREVVWHQDAAYNPMDARSVVVWLAVHDACVENGCMRFIPGSHRCGLLNFNMRSGDQASLGGREIENAAQPGNAVPIELQAGGAVFFSDLLIHSSPGNRSQNAPRGGFTMTFTSADVKVCQHPDFNVSNRESVLCSGEDINGNWLHHPRPVAAA